MELKDKLHNVIALFSKIFRVIPSSIVITDNSLGRIRCLSIVSIVSDMTALLVYTLYVQLFHLFQIL